MFSRDTGHFVCRHMVTSPSVYWIVFSKTTLVCKVGNDMYDSTAQSFQATFDGGCM